MVLTFYGKLIAVAEKKNPKITREILKKSREKMTKKWILSDMILENIFNLKNSDNDG